MIAKLILLKMSLVQCFVGVSHIWEHTSWYKILNWNILLHWGNYEWQKWDLKIRNTAGGRFPQALMPECQPFYGLPSSGTSKVGRMPGLHGAGGNKMSAQKKILPCHRTLLQTRRFSNHESRLLSRSHTCAIIVILDLTPYLFNQRSLTPRWPLTPHLLRSHVWL